VTTGDKLRILDAIKRVWDDRVTTVLTRQWHDATDRNIVAEFPPAGITVEHTGDPLRRDLAVLATR
jgi:hypothetical protein